MHGGHRQKVYPDISISHVREVVNKLIGHEHKFVQIWDLEEQRLQSKIAENDSKEDRNRPFYVSRGYPREFTVFLL